ILSAIVFVLQDISPGDPVKASIGVNASPAAVAAERSRLAPHGSLAVRYVRYVGDAVRGDLGTSYRTHRPVTDDLGDFLPATAELVGAAFALALLFAGLFGFSGA